MNIMVIAGESSGDILAAELVAQLQQQHPNPTHPEPLRFFGAGGPRMAQAGVDLAFDLTRHAVVGLIEVLKNYPRFRILFHSLLQLARSRKPALVILVDFSGFNRRFAHALRTASRNDPNWTPKIVQYVSPQVWASREGRAAKLAQDIDLLLTIFPFEKDWYAHHTPNLQVAFVGHPMLDRHASVPVPPPGQRPSNPPLLLLLPGSRSGELKRHLPVIIPAAQQILRQHPVALRMVLPSEKLLALAQPHAQQLPNLELRLGTLASSLAEATIAIASTGTVTMECACFNVPTVALYKTSWSTYQIGKRIVKVPFLAMPNLLANESIFPELIQNNATPDRIATETLALLNDPARQQMVRDQLAKIIQSLGGPGATQRAATEILTLIGR